MNYFSLLGWQVCLDSDSLDHTTYISFRKSNSADVKFYRVYCQIYPLKVDYDTLHFEIYPSQVDPNDNTMLKANLSIHLLADIRYNIGVSAVNSAGNESDIVELDSITL